MAEIIINSDAEAKLPPGFPTHTQDINGETIRLGDTCVYDFPGDESVPFEIVFRENAFRKWYPHWTEDLWPGGLLENTNYESGVMKIKIIKRA